MEEAPQISSPQPGPSNPVSALLGNKKALIIIGGLLLTVIMVVVLMFSTSGNKKAGPSSSSGTTNETSSGLSPSPSTQEVSAPPQEVAKEFYDWYVSHPAPLSSGEYLSRPDITTEYKENLRGYVTRGLSQTRDDVFNCGDTQLPKDIVTIKTQEDPIQGLSLVLIREISTGENLFQIKLQKVGESWLVRDVWCAP